MNKNLLLMSPRYVPEIYIIEVYIFDNLANYVGISTKY
jgi:hypothetical protein